MPFLSSQDKGQSYCMISGVPENSGVETFLVRVYSEAFGRLGMHMDYSYYPFLRASQMIDNESVDGDLARTLAFTEEHPNVVPVKVAPFTDRFIAYSVNPAIKLNGWESLKEKPLRIDCKRGFQRVEQKIAELGIEKAVYELSDDQQGLLRLLNGRSDVFISTEYFVDPLLMNEFSEWGILKAGILEESAIHAHLLKKHSALAHQLEQVLASMKEEGLLELYLEEAMALPHSGERVGIL